MIVSHFLQYFKKTSEFFALSEVIGLEYQLSELQVVLNNKQQQQQNICVSLWLLAAKANTMC